MNLGWRDIGTTFSTDRAYRYTLSRWDRTLWSEPPRPIVWVMLNPSTADEAKLDPTVTRVASRSRNSGHNGFVVLNLFGVRATDPDDMLHHNAPVGPFNDNWLAQVLRMAVRDGVPVVAAWGVHGGHLCRERDVLDLVPGVPWQCLGTTRKGFPRHPLYIAGDVPLTPWTTRRI